MTLLLQKLAEEVGFLLKQKQLKLATAESCTGGGLSYWITNVSGSSLWFERGFVVYSNEAKIDLLGVKKSTIAEFGAVSKQTVCEMATGALKNSLAHLSVAITGIAGPIGAQPGKPIGTTWIAIAHYDRPMQVTMHIFPGNRQQIRIRIIENVFEQLLTLDF